MIIRITQGGRPMFLLTSKKTGRIISKHRKLADAKAQETAINLSKARAAGHRIPYAPRKKR